MPYLPPDERISGHVARLRKFATDDKIDAVLERCDLRWEGTSISSTDGAINDDMCYRYKRAVKEILGESAYAFAKVNFVLSGCKCEDCQ
jgi:hypothetical protein